ncbi:GNAT family N-acetyltransferase [Paenibacillus alvei]|uniref:GNAT family N-acetyltransferase n=2 Tax=Paenibacillus alvei TaxID=44250 RepID=A0AAP6ZYU3_PAEAL|nr:GNAT family N-acetyltransferase [Paenibacillus alvei]
MSVMKIYFQNIDETALLHTLRAYRPTRVERDLYRHKLINPLPPVSLGTEIEIRAIDEETLSRSGLGNVEAMIEEIEGMWGCSDAFLRHGFGYYAVNEKGDIVNWCTSEYNSNVSCGIGIESISEYQGRGIATATTAQLVKRCAAARIMPHWDCWSSNIASKKVAEKTGFEKVLTYKILLIHLV